MNRPKSTY